MLMNAELWRRVESEHALKDFGVQESVLQGLADKC